MLLVKRTKENIFVKSFFISLDREMIHNDLKYLFHQQEEYCRQRQNAQELNDYRRLYQKPEDAKEWDLNNPDSWKYLTPPRISDNDPHLGPSSAQIFAGEDLQASIRKKVQQEQLKKYFDLQVMNKTKKDEEQRLANLLYDYKQLELSEQSQRFEQIENECHRAIELATRNYNEILVRFYYYYYLNEFYF